MILSENIIKNKRAAFLSLGCKTNAYETEAIKQQFMMYGAEICDFSEIADIYVVNTCTVTNIADKKSRQMLHRARGLNPEAIVVATGCYVQESVQELQNDKSVDILIGNRLKSKVAEYVNEYLFRKNEGNKLCAINDNNNQLIVLNDDLEDYEEMNSLSEYHHTRADIKIQDGCNQFCSYCIIPYARGRISSRNHNEIINEVKNLALKGYKEVVLTGIHISSYGFDDASVREQQALKLESGKMPLVELINDINAIDGIERIRTGSLEPRIITEGFVKELSKCSKFCPHFHLSLQSGCDSVLKRMNRKYSTDEYENACNILRQYYYKPSITTDIIVGFPGETEDEFKKTLDFVEKINFGAIHIFQFSRRAGTQADRMEGQLTNAVKQDRSKKLSEIENRLRNDYETSFEGEIRSVLVEEVIESDGQIYCIGHTPEYVSVIFYGSDDYVNRIVDVRLTADYCNGHVYADFI